MPPGSLLMFCKSHISRNSVDKWGWDCNHSTTQLWLPWMNKEVQAGIPRTKSEKCGFPGPEAVPKHKLPPCKSLPWPTPTCTSHFTCGGKIISELPARWSFNIYLGLYASAAWQVRWIKQASQQQWLGNPSVFLAFHMHLCQSWNSRQHSKEWEDGWMRENFL